MTTVFQDDDLLALSGIQHFAFCPRQWALIHIERQWQDNLLTFEGSQLHQRVDNPFFFEARGNILTARAVPLSSKTLGLYGVADVVEFRASVNDQGISLIDYPGLWHPVPVEYKRGKPKQDDIDAVQLCAQAICLEEMLKVKITHGYLFYGEIKHRVKVVFTSNLRNRVISLTKQMHDLFQQQITPAAFYTRQTCSKCSLADLCLPSIGNNKNKASNYLKNQLKKMLK